MAGQLPRTPQLDPRELPSGRSAIEFADGSPGAIWKLGAHTLLRALLIGSGMYVIGGDRTANLWGRALGGSLAIEAFVVAWVFSRRKAAAPHAD